MDKETRAMFQENREMFQKIFDRFDQMDARMDGMDTRFMVIEHKLDRTEKKVDNLQLDTAVATREIRKDIHNLQDQMETVIAVLQINELIPQ